MVFLLARGLRQHLHPVVGIDGVDVFHVGHHLPVRGIVAFEFVSIDPTRFTALVFE